MALQGYLRRGDVVEQSDSLLHVERVLDHFGDVMRPFVRSDRRQGRGERVSENKRGRGDQSAIPALFLRLSFAYSTLLSLNHGTNIPKSIRISVFERQSGTSMGHS
jgi:hypothetical protein